MIKTNKDKVIEFILQCQPGQPKARDTWQVDHKGIPFILPAIGGITLNVQVGDTVFGWAGDHIYSNHFKTLALVSQNDH